MPSSYHGRSGRPYGAYPFQRPEAVLEHAELLLRAVIDRLLEAVGLLHGPRLRVPPRFAAEVEAYAPERVYLFGSSARGEQGPDSDYDILLVAPDDAEPACVRDVVGNRRRRPTAEWTAQQIIEAFSGDGTEPRFLLRDRDSIYGEAFRRKITLTSIGPGPQ